MLEIGQTSIETARSHDGPKGGKFIRWSIRLLDGTVGRYTSKGKTVKQAKDRARAKAKELLSQGPTKWTLNDNAGKYLEEVTLPTIEGLANKNTRSRYLTAYKQFTGLCSEHDHSAGLSKMTLQYASKFRSLEACLQEISATHGRESARQARNVLTKYFLNQLRRDELIDGDPLAGLSIDLDSMAVNRPQKAVDQTLTVDQYQQVMGYLLNVDVTEVERPKRGRWSKEDAIRVRQKLKDLTILQASTGLRVNEANLAWCGLILGDQDNAGIDVVEEIAKGQVPRRAAVFHPEAAKYLINLRENRRSNQLVIGTPTDPTKPWDSGNRSKKLRQFYEEMATALSIDFLAAPGELTHQWRRHLNTMLLTSVPEVIRAAQFGHSTEINRGHYTNTNQWQATGELARTALTKSGQKSGQFVSDTESITA